MRKSVITVLSGFALLLALSASVSAVDAAAKPNFTTGDGIWDGSFKAVSGSNVDVVINDWQPHHKLKVRVCKSGGSCTSYKIITNEVNYTTFTNLSSGTYYGDVIKAEYPSFPTSGSITFSVY